MELINSKRWRYISDGKSFGFVYRPSRKDWEKNSIRIRNVTAYKNVKMFDMYIIGDKGRVKMDYGYEFIKLQNICLVTDKTNKKCISNGKNIFEVSKDIDFK